MNRLTPILLLIAASLTCVACGSAPETRPALAEAAERRNELAVSAFQGGRYHDAIQLFTEAERYFLGIDDVKGAAKAAISLAEVFLLLNEAEHADAAIGRASARADQIGDTDLYQRIALLQARVLRSKGRDDAAQWILAELAAAEEPIATHARLLRCEMAVAKNRTSCAFDLQAEPDSLLQARILLLQAKAARLRGDAAAAEDYLAEAHEIYRDQRYRPGLASYYESAAYLSGQRDNDDAAREQLLRALYLRLWMQDKAHALQLLRVIENVPAGEVATVPYDEWQQMLREEPDWEQLRAAVFSQLQAQY